GFDLGKVGAVAGIEEQRRCHAPFQVHPRVTVAVPPLRPGSPGGELPGCKRRNPEVAAALDAADTGQPAGVADRVMRELARHGRPGSIFILPADDALDLESPLLQIALRKAERL